MDKDRVYMMSRTGKDMSSHPNLQQIKTDCAKLLTAFDANVCLDGELYGHDMTFETIVSLCRTSKGAAMDQSVSLQYCVYDIINEESFERRHRRLVDAMKMANDIEHIRLVDTSICENAVEANRMHEVITGNGYEGVMLRDPSGVYNEGARSPHLQKFKRFKEDEYTIVGFKEGDGRDEGTVVFQCSLAPHSTDTFWVRPTGTIEQRTRMWQEATDSVGKRLTVMYQGLTQRGVPRFPVGKCIRDYE
jgi:ATP-dependent DNA ligase